MYPSLEDMVVDHVAQKHVAMTREQNGQPALTSNPLSPLSGSLYAGIGLEELSDYGGLNITPLAMERYMPAEIAHQVVGGYQPLVAITPAHDLGIQRAQVKQGVRQVILAKDQQGKVGLAVQEIDKGIFVAFVYRESAAALAGMRVGDQILQINGESVAGWSSDKALKCIKKADGAAISIALRDRPFERTLTVLKDQTNQVGFVFKKGEITAIVKDSSAARNGLLTHHHLMEINGQNVIMMKDEDVLRILKEASRSVTLTIMPTFLYDHLTKSIGSKRLQQFMDHSIPAES